MLYGLDWVQIGLAAAFLGCAMAWPPAAAADPSLVLHYRFDENHGDVARELGPHGNDGKIKNAEYLVELAGRRGVLRFNGASSLIGCGDHETQRFDGDLSLELWVRLNDPEAQGGAVLSWGKGFHLFGIGAPMVEFSNGTDRMRTELAKGMVGDGNAWSHIAVVVEYPRVRLYHNGDLIRDAYMPMTAIKELGGAKYIGSKCAIDLDEIRVYRRALTAREIIAHANGREMPPGRDAELAVEPHWYDEIVTVRLSCKGFEFAGHTAQIALRTGDGTELAGPTAAELVEAFEGSGRYVARATYPLAGLAGSIVDGVARIQGPAGELVETVYRHASLEKPAWVHNREGYSDDVLPPWTPVEARQGEDGTAEVSVWGRRHIFADTPLAQQIETGGKEILAAPISLEGRADGEVVSWTGGSARLTDTSRTAASLEQLAETESLSLRINSTMEFDGYMISRCEVKARRDTTLEELVLQIPLHTRHATLCFGSNVYPEKLEPREIPMAVLHMGAVDGDLAFRFSPSVWLGDEERGLTWQAESNEDWHYADAQKAIEILPQGDITRFRANWVNVPVKLAAGEILLYEFALQATPVKPMLRDAWDLRILRSDPYTDNKGNLDLNLPDRWIDLDHEKTDRIYSVNVPELNRTEDGPNRKPALRFYADAGIRHLWINTHDNWPWPLPADKTYGLALRRLIDAAHGQGLKIYGYLIHERMPTNVPEFDTHGRHMSHLPLSPYDGLVGFCAKSKAAQDAIVYNFARRMDAYGDDGVYLDGTGVHLKSCANPAHGCGYRPRQGSMHIKGAVAFDQGERGSAAEDAPVYPTYPVFADREFIKRLYTVVKQRRPDGVVDVHSWYFNSGGLAYADMLWTGEQWWHHRGKGVAYVAEELTLDIFRTAFMGYQFGVPAETLAYRLLPNNAKNSQVAATSLLHDIPVRVRAQDTEYFDIMSRLWQVREEFGAKEAEKRFYWHNQDYVRVSPDTCYATLLHHPRNGVLAFITNLDRDAQTADVQFSLDALGLDAGKLEVFDVLTDEKVTLSADGGLSIPLESEAWQYVWLKPIE